MLDIQLLREDQGGNPELVRESQRRRFASVELVDEVIAMDQKWRACRGKLDLLNKDCNTVKRQIGEFKKKKEEPPAELFTKKKEAEEAITACEKEEAELIVTRDKKLACIGNLVPDDVPVSQDEELNQVTCTWGEFKTDETKMSHVDLYLMAGIADTERGSVVSGNRAYYLTGLGAALNQALVAYGLDFLNKRGYKTMQTPYFMKKDIMGKVAQLEQFDEELYKVTGEGDDKYLIATSEQTICAYHLNDWLDPKALPIKYAGFSSCFRKEVGSHGRDTLGIFRVHQFEKIEQFVVCSPEGDESWKMQEEMIKNSEEFYKTLGIPYRVVNIVSGELNNAAAKKYDLEAWFPGSNTHRELVSCSNCLDYQTRRLEVRYGQKKGSDSKKVYCHMLNSTLTATERTMCCVLENYQTETGIKVPDVLVPFMGGVDFIPYVTPPPKVKGKKLSTYRVPTAADEAARKAGQDDLASYLKEHAVESTLNTLLNQMAKERPVDPIAFLAAALGKASSPLTSESKTEEKPKIKLGGNGIEMAADEIKEDGGDATMDDFLDAFA